MRGVSVCMYHLSTVTEWGYTVFIAANLFLIFKKDNKTLFVTSPPLHILDLLWSRWNKSNTFKQFFSEFHFSVSCHKFSEQYHHSRTWKFSSLNHKSFFHSLSFSSVFLLLRDSGMEMATTPHPVSWTTWDG